MTGLEACRRHGVRRGPIPVARSTCSFPRSGSSRASEFVVVERTMRLPAPMVRDGVPLTPVVRACLDGARRLHSAAEITELIADTVQRRLCTPAQLAAELREGSQRGSATPRRVLADVAEGVRSTAERDAKRLLRAAGCPSRGGTWRCRRPGPAARDSGRLVRRGRTRLGDQLLRLAPEPQSYASEVKRTAGMTAEGVTVLPVLPTALATATLPGRWRARRGLRGGGTATATPGAGHPHRRLTRPSSERKRRSVRSDVPNAAFATFRRPPRTLSRPTGPGPGTAGSRSPGTAAGCPRPAGRTPSSAPCSRA